MLGCEWERRTSNEGKKRQVFEEDGVDRFGAWPSSRGAIRALLYKQVPVYFCSTGTHNTWVRTLHCRGCRQAGRAGVPVVHSGCVPCNVWALGLGVGEWWAKGTREITDCY